MAYIIYAGSVNDFEGNNFTNEFIKNKFLQAIEYNKKAQEKGLKTAYMFIDPLLDSFEAANRFYFNILECREISSLNVYRSGCGPIQAVSDAYNFISNEICDLVFIFGYEPLATFKIKKGKKVLSKAMDIYDGVMLPEAYNRLTKHLLEILNISHEQFFLISNALYENYKKTYGKNSETVHDRTKKMSDFNADLFTLTDCANPYVDFSGGVIISSDKAAQELKVARKDITQLRGAGYKVVGDGPDFIEKIAGTKENIYPHLENAYNRVCADSGIDYKAEFKNQNGLLEAYTCYPPSPMALLLATGLVENIDEMVNFLDHNEITVTGGMNLARGPWNNPALNGLISMHNELKTSDKEYGLVHGNGGLGGFQGLALLSKVKEIP